MMTACQENSVP